MPPGGIVEAPLHLRPGDNGPAPERSAPWFSGEVGRAVPHWAPAPPLCPTLVALGRRSAKAASCCKRRATVAWERGPPAMAGGARAAQAARVFSMPRLA